jgi:hypothetical protein
MGNNIRTGSKRPKTKDLVQNGAQFVPLPKMYQIGINKGIEQERERILSILEIVEQEDPNDTLSFIKIDPLSLKRLKGLIGEQK